MFGKDILHSAAWSSVISACLEMPPSFCAAGQLPVSLGALLQKAPIADGETREVGKKKRKTAQSECINCSTQCLM